MNAVAAPQATIRWPAHYAPARAAVHVRNELAIAAPPAIVWSWLVRAEHWPRWYSNASDIHFEALDGPDLRAGSRFRWKTFGVAIASVVLEFEPQTRIAWNGKAFGLDVYHAWLLTPTPDGGCHVVTEETQHGIVARAGKLIFPGRMYRFHQIWLESLAGCAARGKPAR